MGQGGTNQPSSLKRAGRDRCPQRSSHRGGEIQGSKDDKASISRGGGALVLFVRSFWIPSCLDRWGQRSLPNARACFARRAK
jgi:hypothetical protein